jgi:pilus assembly protein CpaE
LQTITRQDGVSLNIMPLNTLKIVVAGGNDAERTAVRTALAEITEPKLEIADAAASPAASSANGAGTEVVMTVLGDEPEGWPTQLKDWAGREPRPPLVALISRHSAETVRMALRAGAEEVLVLPVDSNELTRCLVKISETHQDAGLSRSTTLSLVSVAGGVGVSSLTAALAFAIRRLTQKQVALVDLGLQCSALSAILDLEPEHSISELADPTSAIDSIRLESVLCKHDSGLQLLAAPKRIEEAELISAATVATTLKLMDELFDFILIDCGHSLNEGSVAAWERSQHLLYVVDQSVTSVRPAQRFLNLFERLQLKSVKPEFLLNRFDLDNPITVDQIEMALRRAIITKLPRDEESFAKAQITGGDLFMAAPNSPVRVGVESLAGRLCGGASGVNGFSRRSIFARLFSAVRPQGAQSRWD